MTTQTIKWDRDGVKSEVDDTPAECPNCQKMRESMASMEIEMVKMRQMVRNA